jgi:hypothetical protein
MKRFLQLLALLGLVAIMAGACGDDEKDSNRDAGGECDGGECDAGA